MFKTLVVKGILIVEENNQDIVYMDTATPGPNSRPGTCWQTHNHPGTSRKWVQDNFPDVPVQIKVNKK